MAKAYRLWLPAVAVRELVRVRVRVGVRVRVRVRVRVEHTCRRYGRPAPPRAGRQSAGQAARIQPIGSGWPMLRAA